MDKNFVIKCTNCQWKELTTGISRDLGHLVEIPRNCEKCGKARKFRCPICKGVAKMYRIKGNV